MKTKQKTAPKHLSREAKALWKSLLNDYCIEDSAGIVILTTALEAYDTMKSAEGAIRKEGMTVLDKWQQIKPHPLLTTLRDARAQFLQGLKALNLDISPLRDAPGRPGGK